MLLQVLEDFLLLLLALDELLEALVMLDVLVEFLALLFEVLLLAFGLLLQGLEFLLCSVTAVVGLPSRLYGGFNTLLLILKFGL